MLGLTILDIIHTTIRLVAPGVIALAVLAMARAAGPSWFGKASSCIALMMLAACRPPAVAPPPAPPPPHVTVVAAVEKEVMEWDEYTGRMDAKESVEIRARVSGYLDKVHFEEGKMVKAGDPLFTIDKRPYAAEQAALAAEKAQAQTRADLAQADFDRVDKLIKSKAISQEDYETRAKMLAEARSSVQAAEARLAIADLNLAFTEVSSPISGRVSRTHVTVGNLIIGGTSGTTLLTTVVSLDPIYAYADVEEPAVLKYRRLAAAGKRTSAVDTHIPCRIQLSDETGFPHEGVVDFVDNRINPGSGTVLARVVVPNPKLLFTPGMFVRIQVPGSGKYQAVLIPDRALATDQAQRFVYVVGEDGKAQFRPVKLGPLIDGQRVIAEGLKAGEKVITEGIINVRPGSPVTAVPAPATNTPPAAAR
jgi:RND family efflux transporter MFP subunit